jgi:hypothetical protein
LGTQTWVFYPKTLHKAEIVVWRQNKDRRNKAAKRLRTSSKWCKKVKVDLKESGKTTDLWGLFSWGPRTDLRVFQVYSRVMEQSRFIQSIVRICR